MLTYETIFSFPKWLVSAAFALVGDTASVIPRRCIPISHLALAASQLPSHTAIGFRNPCGRYDYSARPTC